MARLVRLAVAMLCAHVGLAHALQMDVQPAVGGAWILLSGEFKPGDGERFTKLLAATRNAIIVVLQSPGGSLKSGLDIGTTIREHKMSTLVQNNTTCASACAAAWLGGSRRYIEPSARIGFHSSYTEDWRNNPTESRGGNALLGAYANRIGLSDRAAYYITEADPKTMTWLTFNAAKQLGIEVFPFNNGIALQNAPRGGTATAPETPQADSVQAGIAQLAQMFPAMFFEQIAQRPEIALDYLQSTYADDVTYNGAVVARAQVLELQRRRAERWPDQAYAVRPDSVTVKCSTGSGLCEVAGIADWEWSSWGRGARANGSSRFWFQISMESRPPVVRAETITVISRQGTGPQ